MCPKSHGSSVGQSETISYLANPLTKQDTGESNDLTPFAHVKFILKKSTKTLQR